MPNAGEAFRQNEAFYEGASTQLPPYTSYEPRRDTLDGVPSYLWGRPDPAYAAPIPEIVRKDAGAGKSEGSASRAEEGEKKA